MPPDAKAAKRPVGRPRTRTATTMAEYQERSRQRYLDKGIGTFTVKLPLEVIEQIKIVAEGTGLTRSELIIELIKAATEGDSE